MSCSALYILDATGKTLLRRDYRGDLPHDVPERFAAAITGAE